MQVRNKSKYLDPLISVSYKLEDISFITNYKWVCTNQIFLHLVITKSYKMSETIMPIRVNIIKAGVLERLFCA